MIAVRFPDKPTASKWPPRWWALAVVCIVLAFVLGFWFEMEWSAWFLVPAAIVCTICGLVTMAWDVKSQSKCDDANPPS